ncbi:hypothetical protein FJ657_05530 [Schumannella soli]|uniref:Protein-L-isoaspartate carboxylmethyltransferase n=1 Tax=Schumannella soli TaxID=2590779 RepID=A0A506Y855_9MICO|nr:hypothetical protein FJ657_05530 [Schumannella soli]
MPFRSKTTLEAWVEEFALLGYPQASQVRVIVQDAGDGDTGLVAVTLTDATTVTYIQPIVVGSPRWVVTFEAREEQLELAAADVARLSADLAVVSALCAFFQAKSASFVATQAATAGDS